MGCGDVCPVFICKYMRCGSCWLYMCGLFRMVSGVFVASTCSLFCKASLEQALHSMECSADEADHIRAEHMSFINPGLHFGVSSWQSSHFSPLAVRLHVSEKTVCVPAAASSYPMPSLILARPCAQNEHSLAHRRPPAGHRGLWPGRAGTLPRRPHRKRPRRSQRLRALAPASNSRGVRAMPGHGCRHRGCGRGDGVVASHGRPRCSARRRLPRCVHRCCLSQPPPWCSPT